MKKKIQASMTKMLRFHKFFEASQNFYNKINCKFELFRGDIQDYILFVNKPKNI